MRKKKKTLPRKVKKLARGGGPVAVATTINESLKESSGNETIPLTAKGLGLRISTAGEGKSNELEKEFVLRGAVDYFGSRAKGKCGTTIGTTSRIKKRRERKGMGGKVQKLCATLHRGAKVTRKSKLLEARLEKTVLRMVLEKFDDGKSQGKNAGNRLTNRRERNSV